MFDTEETEIQKNIKDKIEKLRNRLDHLLTDFNQTNGFNDEIIQLSRDLDEIINLYHRLCQP